VENDEIEVKNFKNEDTMDADAFEEDDETDDEYRLRVAEADERQEIEEERHVAWLDRQQDEAELEAERLTVGEQQRKKEEEEAETTRLFENEQEAADEEDEIAGSYEGGL
jgi:hypothetical protein